MASQALFSTKSSVGVEMWDRDYILDDRGNYLRVIGERHPKEYVVSYVKYFPDELGRRQIGGRIHGYNSFVSKSYVILKNDPGRVSFSPAQGGILTVTPVNRIVRTYACDAKLKEIIDSPKKYKTHPVGCALLEFLDSIAGKVDFDQIGITGSFLIDAFDESSDIDLVCYGKETADKIRDLFRAHSEIEAYEGRHAIRLYSRRMIHMAPMDFDTLMSQESRKIQGLWRGRIHINCQPVRSRNSRSVFSEIKCAEIGEISCIAEITNDSDGQFSPSYYGIRILDILDSLFSGDQGFMDKIKVFISFIGAYSGCFRLGERVYIDGKLIEVQDGQSQYYAIEVSPWNTSRTFKAQLIRKF